MRADWECWRLPWWSQGLNDDIHQALSGLKGLTVGFLAKACLGVEDFGPAEGRMVYLALNCHLQFVLPHSASFLTEGGEIHHC